MFPVAGQRTKANPSRGGICFLFSEISENKCDRDLSLPSCLALRRETLIGWTNAIIVMHLKRVAYFKVSRAYVQRQTTFLLHLVLLKHYLTNQMRKILIDHKPCAITSKLST